MKRQGVRYLQAWKALGSILRDGGSWSGHEKNCCFLNTHSDQFADVSTIVGLDQNSDSRAIAVVDWDQDGDLDLWSSNRTAPRVRYLQNEGSEGSYLALRLQGTTGNRDAIGARVELLTTFHGKSFTDIQTLRAGEGYLAQSSKWLHFGLGQAELERVTVRWPGGVEQSFSGLRKNTRYLVIEGQEPQPFMADRDVALPDVKLPAPVVDDGLRIIPARRLPMPDLQLRDGRGRAFTLAYQGHDFTLLTIWATWCRPCITELRELSSRSVEMKRQGIRWMAANVDELGSHSVDRLKLAQELLAEIGVSREPILATQGAVECLDVVQRSLVTKQDPLPIPCSFLMDERGNLMAVYKGGVVADDLKDDVALLDAATPDPRDPAIPFPGLWSMDAFPPDLMAVPTELANIGRSAEALSYMVKHVPIKDFVPPVTVEQVTNGYLSIARDLAGKGNTDAAEAALKQALRVNEGSVQAHMAIAELYLHKHKAAEAAAHYRSVLEVIPQQPMSLNNLAWLLATSSDPNVRAPQESVSLAERLCEQTDHKEPVSLDTLAVAYAAAGQFDKAARTLENAIGLAKRLGHPTTKMNMRLQLFRDERPYVDR